MGQTQKSLIRFTLPLESVRSKALIQKSNNDLFLQFRPFPYFGPNKTWASIHYMHPLHRSIALEDANMVIIV